VKRVLPGRIAALMGFIIICAIAITFIQIIRKGELSIALTAILTAGYDGAIA
jgi:hypothetical protein